jgi:phage/plasmid-like protein (TIGR03299 family)
MNTQRIKIESPATVILSNFARALTTLTVIFMGHMINISENGRANCMVVGTPAWHKLGQVLANPATAEEAIKEAGLDFIVEKRPLFLSDMTPVPMRYATVRTDTNQPLGVVSNRYNILQNVEGFKFFDSVVERDEAIYHSAGVLGKGERVWIMAKLPEYIAIKNTDAIELYVTMMLGHDGKTSASAFVHAERIVCNNTMQIALGQARKSGKIIKFKHDSNIINQVTDGAMLLGIVNQYTTDLKDVFTTLSEQKVDKAYVNAFVEALFPALPPEIEAKMVKTPSYKVFRGQVLEAIEAGAGQDMPTTQGTAFGLYNGVTFFLDHMKNGYGNDSKKQASIWFGDAARVRQRAFDLLNYDSGELEALALIPQA